MSDKRPYLREDIAMAEMIKQVEFEFEEWKSGKEAARKQSDVENGKLVEQPRHESTIDLEPTHAIKKLGANIKVAFAN